MKIIYIFACVIISQISWAQEEASTSYNLRKIHYQPDVDGFILKNGSKKFNRALYGTNTGFRVETGDLPEFAMYLPGMGGNFKLGIAKANQSKWITTCDSIKTRYVPGTMLYEIRDALLHTGVIKIQVLAHAEQDGMLIKIEAKDVPESVKLIWAFGGVSGKKFHRDGDIGADPESVFYLHPSYCKNNEYILKSNAFVLSYGAESPQKETVSKKIIGYYPNGDTKVVEAFLNKTPTQLLLSKADKSPMIMGVLNLKPKDTLMWKFTNNAPLLVEGQQELQTEFEKALNKIQELANRVYLNTPDPYVNKVGASLAIAADAIWESPAFLHGAVAWRMHLNGWRGAYVADPLGWHDRAKIHFENYANSQIVQPEKGPVCPDTLRNLARQKEVLGTNMFSSGYISRHPNNNKVAHHYDMNSVFINQLGRHYQWTGDLEFIKDMWPIVKRHLAWEKRNFDSDNNGLYDAYAAIWASDALQYSGGDVTYASAYNYSANLMATSIAKLLGENPDPYLKEVQKIKNAIQNKLWSPEKGVFAEYKDLLGNKLLHDAPALWTIYHALDEGIANSFQAYQSLQYIDANIPHISVNAQGLPIDDLYVLSTSNWQPYTWSVNNVALAENLHTSLAYWQGGRSKTAFKLWKSALVESMFLGASPGNFQQLSYYDAMRGELYRDFADPIGMAARSLVEGLFGINPKALENTLFITPGLPVIWGHASLHIPDISFDFVKMKNISKYTICPKFQKEMSLHFSVDAYSGIDKVEINGKSVSWSLDMTAIGHPKIILESPYQDKYDIVIHWDSDSLEIPKYEFNANISETLQFKTSKAQIIKVYNPQSVISVLQKDKHQLNFKVIARSGEKTCFVQLKQQKMLWWQPLHFKISQQPDTVTKHQNWDMKLPSNTNFDMVSLTHVFNCKVTDIFEQQYLTPRPTSSTLQLPTQGVGNWCYPLVKPEIDDSGLRNKAGLNNKVLSPQGIPFSTPSDRSKKNVVFVSQWDNFPNSIEVPLSGTASHAYFMVVGTTNPMQSRLVNGLIEVKYTDGSSERLDLKNPENWWPIEQDYFVDGKAFTTDAPKPPRVYFKTGIITRNFKDFKPIKGFSDFGVEGGAATILDVPLNRDKTLKSLTIKAIANDVVIGLMSLTLVRN